MRLIYTLFAVCLISPFAIAARPKIPPQRNLQVIFVTNLGLEGSCVLIGKDSHPKEDELSVMFSFDPDCDFAGQFAKGDQVIVAEDSYIRMREEGLVWHSFTEQIRTWGITEDAEIFNLHDLKGITK